jgi:hypothetical protein
MRHPVEGGKVRDWILYVGIAILLVGMIAAFAVRDADAGRSRSLPLKWIGFVGTTAIVFGYAIRACRPSWRIRKFWYLLSLFLAAHLGLGVFVLTAVDRVALWFYGLLSGVEYAVLSAYLGFFLDAD